MVASGRERAVVGLGAVLLGALLVGVALFAEGAVSSVVSQDDDARSGAVRLRPGIAARYPGVRWVDTATLARWLEGDEPPVLLDARAVAEHRVSHLRGATRVDPDAPDIAALGPHRGARVVVYCSVGWRSADIASRLRGAGFGDVYNLEGGIFAWGNEGRPLYRGARRVRVVHPYDATWGRLLDARLHATRPPGG